MENEQENVSIYQRLYGRLNTDLMHAKILMGKAQGTEEKVISSQVYLKLKEALMWLEEMEYDRDGN